MFFNNYVIFYMGSSKASGSLISINSQELKTNIKDKEDMWIYIGRPTCQECEKFSPVLKEFLKENKKSIYYYNTDKATKENKQEMISLLEELEIKLVPTIIHLKEGKIIKSSVGYQNKTSLEKLLID